MTDLAERFRTLRRRKGLTSTALAQPRYSVSYVSQIERGLRHPSIDALRYFASRLGVSAAYLETGIPDDLPRRLEYEMERVHQAISNDHPEEAADIARRVVQQAEEFHMALMRNSALCVLGDALYQATRYREAIDAFERARQGELTREDAVRAAVGLGRSYRAVGDLSYGIEIIEALLRTDLDPPLESRALAQLHSVLVSVYFERGDMVRAERAAGLALAAIDASTPPRTEAETWWTISRVLAEQERWEEALDAAKRARLLMEGLHHRHDQAKLHISSAFLCLEAKPPRTDEAEVQIDQAEILFRQTEALSDLAFVHTERARLLYIRGAYDEAVVHARHAVQTEGAQYLERARAFYVEGRALAALGRWTDARHAFDSAALIFESHGARKQLASTLREIGELSATEGELSRALESYRAAFDTLEPLGPRP